MNNMRTPQEEIEGSVEKVLFSSPDTGYSVFRFHISSINSIIVTGHLSDINAGEQLTLHGHWITHAKFGKQFQATHCTKKLPVTIVGIQKYLSSGLIKGIGPVNAKKIIEKFGLESLAVIDKQCERLFEISGIGEKRVALIKDAWQSQKEISSIMVFLQDKGISPAFAAKIYKKYGQSAITLITENPYRLAEDIWGVGFKSADNLAQKIGIAKNSIKRVKSGIRHILTTITQLGHLYIEISDLKQQIKDLLELAQDDQTITKYALHELYDQQIIKLLEYNNIHYITLSVHYFTEKGLAEKILACLNHQQNESFHTGNLLRSLCSEQDKILLNDDQQQAIASCLDHKMTIITGGPGTGKTTLIKKLLSILDQEKKQYFLTAPTGRAAKRMSESTGKYAMTIHRLLAFDPATMAFKYNEKNALATDFLIIDEASMIDTFLAYALFKAIKLTTHIVLIGDIDQLPSVGAGQILHDLITSKKIPCTRLNHIFRQSHDSLITINAHKINHGQFPTTYLEYAKKDFLFIKEDYPENLPFHLHKIYRSILPAHTYTAKDSMVLVPMNRGLAGTLKINTDLQQLLNPDAPQSLNFMGINYQLNDRVMQVRNNYDKSVFNGDIGEIINIDKESSELTISFDNREIVYAREDLNEIILAYAISIHKSQGSEYPIIIVPIFMQHFVMLARNLLYTAITRAKKLCIFIGQPKAIAMAIKNNKTIIRKTFLKEFLICDLSCK